ncbi:hypothetical protein H4582DRAFT_395621 [Lactarius indigo]|nr:hypothetical protein H4582DRAFT_395621 [Lactarius indigo]
MMEMSAHIVLCRLCPICFIASPLETRSTPLFGSSTASLLFPLCLRDGCHQRLKRSVRRDVSCFNSTLLDPNVSPPTEHHGMTVFG